MKGLASVLPGGRGEGGRDALLLLSDACNYLTDVLEQAGRGMAEALPLQPAAQQALADCRVQISMYRS